jgi:prefoldin subunit 5
MMDEKLCQMVMGDDYVNVIYTIGTFYYNCRKYDEALELLTKFPETIKPER